MQKLICQFYLLKLQNIKMVDHIVSSCYDATGSKFSVTFNGSKGYLSNVEISAEGHQVERNNIIWIEKLISEKGRLNRKWVNVYYSWERGVSVEIVNSIRR